MSYHYNIPELIERLESIASGHGGQMLDSQKLAIREAVQRLEFFAPETTACACGYRAESPRTHPHVIGCPHADYSQGEAPGLGKI